MPPITITITITIPIAIPITITIPIAIAIAIAIAIEQYRLDQPVPEIRLPDEVAAQHRKSSLRTNIGLIKEHLTRRRTILRAQSISADSI